MASPGGRGTRGPGRERNRRPHQSAFRRRPRLRRSVSEATHSTHFTRANRLLGIVPSIARRGAGEQEWLPSIRRRSARGEPYVIGYHRDGTLHPVFLVAREMADVVDFAELVENDSGGSRGEWREAHLVGPTRMPGLGARSVDLVKRRRADDPFMGDRVVVLEGERDRYSSRYGDTIRREMREVERDGNLVGRRAGWRAAAHEDREQQRANPAARRHRAPRRRQMASAAGAAAKKMSGRLGASISPSSSAGAGRGARSRPAAWRDGDPWPVASTARSYVRSETRESTRSFVSQADVGTHSIRSSDRRSSSSCWEATASCSRRSVLPSTGRSAGRSSVSRNTSASTRSLGCL